MYYGYQTQSGKPDPRPPQSPVQPNLELARAYVPDQPYTRIFSPEEALCQGTLFPDLVRPYTGKC
jgi:hypothetical protein